MCWSAIVQQYMTDANYTIVERLSEWAGGHGHTIGDSLLHSTITMPMRAHYQCTGGWTMWNIEIEYCAA